MNDMEIADLKVALGDALTVVGRVQAHADQLDPGRRELAAQLVRQAYATLDAALDSLKPVSPAEDELHEDDDWDYGWDEWEDD